MAMRGHHRFCLGFWVLAAMAAPCAAEEGLPPPPHSADLSSRIPLLLELVVNDAPTGRVVPVEAEGGHFLVAADDLRAAELRLDPAMAGPVDTGSLAGVQTTYDQGSQRLLLRVPDAWLPLQRRGRMQAVERIRPESNFGLMFNYDLYASDSDGGTRYASLWNEVRMFGDFGVARNTGLLRIASPGGGRRYTRFDTSWTSVDDETVRTYEAGDLITRTQSWSNPVRLGGVQVSRDFHVRPDIVTYPLPVFSGAASVPSAVDLFINGYRTSTDLLQPGPFTLSNVPYVNGAGEAVVVTTDAQGRQISTAIPFYVANTLLRPGLSDFAVAAGTLRRHYGQRNFAYGATAASGAWRYGLNDWLTVEAQGQAASSLALGGIGGVMRIGNLGVVDASATLSRHDGRTSTQTTIGYQFTGRHFSVTASHIRRDRDFTDLSGYGHADYRLPHRQTQANASVVLGGQWGTIGAGYIESRQRDDRFRLANLSWFKPLWGSSSLYMSATRAFGSGDVTAMAQLIIPLGRRGTALAGVARERDGTVREQVGWNRAVPSDGGIGWNLAGSHGGNEGTRYQAELTWRTDALQVQGGIHGSRGNQTRWGDVSGSVVMMDGGVFASNRIYDSFVLVSTDGISGVPVRYENQDAGKTDRNGHLLVPLATAYYGAKYEIDPLDLPADVATPLVEQRAAVKLGSGRLVRFPVRRIVSATVILHGADGAALAPGTAIRINGATTTYVGWGGAAWIEELQPLNRIDATLDEGRSCTARFPLDPARPGPATLGPLTCR